MTSWGDDHPSPRFSAAFWEALFFVSWVTGLAIMYHAGLSEGLNYARDTTTYVHCTPRTFGSQVWCYRGER